MTTFDVSLISEATALFCVSSVGIVEEFVLVGQEVEQGEAAVREEVDRDGQQVVEQALEFQVRLDNRTGWVIC